MPQNLVSKPYTTQRTRLRVRSIVQQEFSWGPFCVTVDTFLGLIEAEQVFNPFLDRLGSFGEKIREEETKWRGFWGSISCGATSYC